MLRKVGMVGSIICLAIADMIININFLAFIPQDVLQVFHLQRVGLCEFFALMFTLYEATSVLKNMVLCDIPIPKSLKKKTEEMLKKMTSELDHKK